jgi:transcriptional regulator with XRE-family HTH domain
MKQPDLGKKILELRLAKGLTQGELAEKCNISLRTIQRIELAEVTPRSYTIKLIFSCLEYDYYNSFDELPNESDRSVFGTKVWIDQFYKYVLELFNLKTNTMKKVSFLSITLLLIAIGLFMVNHESNAQPVPGWFKAGSKPNSYKVGLDKTIFKSGGSSAFMESTEANIDGFGTLMQQCSAQEYLGKRVKMTAYVKSENVSGSAAMWLRVDSKLTPQKSLSFDNMNDRPIKGNNDWTKCEIILDVPEESGTLNYGVLLGGTGKVWFDDISFEVVDKQTMTTTPKNLIPDKPTNIDFEK